MDHFVFLQVPLPKELHTRLRREAHRLKRRPADLASIWLADAIQRQTKPDRPADTADEQLGLFDGKDETSHYSDGL